jgi:hypothetical protein
MLGAFTLTGLGAAIASVLIASPKDYLAILTNPRLEALNTSPEMMVNIHAIFVNLGLDNPIAKVLAAGAVLALVVAIPRGAPLDRWFWAMIAGGVLISPHAFGYDASRLLAPILLILFEPGTGEQKRQRRYRQWVAATAVIPLPYFLTLLPPPYAGLPALLITTLFLVIAYPGWFERAPGQRFGMVPTPVAS